jgi:hypothetical protein
MQGYLLELFRKTNQIE